MGPSGSMSGSLDFDPFSAGEVSAVLDGIEASLRANQARNIVRTGNAIEFQGGLVKRTITGWDRIFNGGDTRLELRPGNASTVEYSFSLRRMWRRSLPGAAIGFGFLFLQPVIPWYQLLPVLTVFLALCWMLWILPLGPLVRGFVRQIVEGAVGAARSAAHDNDAAVDSRLTSAST